MFSTLPRFLSVAVFGLSLLTLSAHASGQAAPKGQVPGGAVTTANSTGNSAVAQQLFDWVFNKVQARGVNHIANLDVSVLRESMRNIEYRFIGGIILGGSGGHRSGAIHLVEQRQVMINEIMWNQMAQTTQTLLFLHEGLGAAGYNDEQYSLSLTLWYLAYGPSEDAARFAGRLDSLFTGRSYSIDDHEKIYQGDTVDSEMGRSADVQMGEFASKEGGGATVIGGGGDGEEIAFKILLLSASSASLEKLRTFATVSERDLALVNLQSAILFFKPYITQDLSDGTMRIRYLPDENCFSLHTSMQVTLNSVPAGAQALIGFEKMLQLPVSERTPLTVDVLGYGK